MRIELQNIHKYFGPVRANDGISMTLEPGRIHGLLGENGAGKTTLMKILSGYQAKDSGELIIDGQTLDFRSPAEAIQAGIGMLHQDPLDFPPMSALDNFLLGFDKQLIPKRQEGHRLLLELAQRFNFTVDPGAPVERMTVGERQQLEIVRLLALGVQVIILDEPTTGISAPQKIQLFATLRRLAHEEDKAIVFVSHKLEEVEDLCDEITVLRRGKVTGRAEMPVPIDELVRLMFGQSIALPDKPPLTPGKPVLEAQNLTLKSSRLQITQANLTVHAGEVVGFAGMEGSGQALFLRALAGLIRPQAGSIRLDGVEMRGRAYREFMAAGINLLPADRIAEGLIKGLHIAEHFPLRRPTPFFIDWEENQVYTEQQIAFFNIKGRPDTLVDDLSGGNQQRVLLALPPKNLRVLILEHPTRGLDMESTRWVWEQLLKRREGGTAILFTSADLDEIMTYSDRVIVFFNGEMFPPLPSGELTVEELGYMIGGKRRQPVGDLSP
ncbi:MAG: sugar ABC transporter ATP-binding protein [Chloroflexi bacterium]|nr:MAG: sugar ABC transporter ATP-binding protein [Chloroflexota bacterium]